MIRKHERAFEIQNYESAKMLYALAHNIRRLKSANNFFVNRDFMIRDYEWSKLEDWQKDVVSIEICKIYDDYKKLANKTKIAMIDQYHKLDNDIEVANAILQNTADEIMKEEKDLELYCYVNICKFPLLVLKIETINDLIKDSIF